MKKVKVPIAAVRGTELIQFRATLAIFHQDDFKKARIEYRLLDRMDALEKWIIIRFTPYQTTTLPK